MFLKLTQQQDQFTLQRCVLTARIEDSKAIALIALERRVCVGTMPGRTSEISLITAIATVAAIIAKIFAKVSRKESNKTVFSKKTAINTDYSIHG